MEDKALLDRKNKKRVFEDYVQSPQETSKDEQIRLVEAGLDSIGVSFYHYVMVTIFGIANAADAVEVLMTQFVLEDDEFSANLESHHHKDVLKMGVSSGVFIGMLIGGFCGGLMADIIGRKITLLFYLIIACSSLVAISLTGNLWIFVACRLIGGFGVGGSVPAMWSLAAELLPSHQRGYFLVIIAFYWQVGALLVSLMAFVILDRMKLSWRVFVGGCAIPAGLSVCLVSFLLVESPRFLVQKHKPAKAAKTIKWIAHRCSASVPVQAATLTLCASSHSTSLGRLSSSTVSSIIADPSSRPTSKDQESDKNKLISTAASVPVADVEAASDGDVSDQSRPQRIGSDIIENVRLLYRGHLLRPMLVLQVVWITLNFGSYGISSWVTVLFDRMGLSNPYLCAVVYALAAVPGTIFGGYAIDRIGRKPLLQYGLLLSAVSAVVFAALALESNTIASQVSTALKIVMACLFSFFTTICWCSLDCVSAEMFPTQCRNSAMGILTASGRISSVLAQVVFVSEVTRSPAMVLFVTAAVTLVGAGFVWKGLHNTKNEAIG